MAAYCCMVEDVQQSVETWLTTLPCQQHPHSTAPVQQPMHVERLTATAACWGQLDEALACALHVGTITEDLWQSNKISCQSTRADTEG